MTTPNIQHATTPAQRQLLFGPDSVGKTRAMLTVVASFPAQSFYLLSPQDGESQLMEQYGGAAGLPNLVRLPVQNWADVRLWTEGTAALKAHDKRMLSAALREVGWPGLGAVVQPGDWVLVDMVNELHDQMLRDYYCLVVHKRTYADIIAFAETRNARGGRSRMLAAFDEIDSDAWTRMKALATAGFGWLFRNPRVNCMMTTQGVEVAVKLDGSPLYPTAAAYVELGWQPRIPEIARYGLSTIVFMRKRSASYEARLVQKDRARVGGPDKVFWTVGLSYWHSFCEKAGIDPSLPPGL